MSVTRGTGILNGTDIIRGTGVSAHTGIVRTAGSTTPLEDAVDALIGASDQGSYYKIYDYTTLSSLSDGSSRLSTQADGQDVAFAEGFTTNATPINVSQATAARTLLTSSNGDLYGMIADGSIDSLFATGLTGIRHPVTFGFRFRQTATSTKSRNAVVLSSSPYNVNSLLSAYVQGSGAGGDDAIYSLAAYDSAAGLSNGDYYRVAVFNTTSSLGRLDGTQNITASASDISVDATSIQLGGVTGVNDTSIVVDILSKAFWIDRALNASEITTLEAWLAVDGDA